MQVLWVLDHLSDLESDFSAIHRIDDMYGLPSRKFFAFAYRMPAYAGCMQVALQEDDEQRQLRGNGMVVGDTTYREVPGDAVGKDIELSEFIEMGGA